MGYKEEILENGNFKRTYFAFDSTKFYAMYHNGHEIMFPTKEMQLGENQRINFMINFNKFESNISLVNIKIVFKANKAHLKYDINLTKESSMKSNDCILLDTLVNSDKYIYEIDLTKYFDDNLLKKRYFGVNTAKNIIFHSIYSSYDLMPEIVVEYIPKYMFKNLQRININKNIDSYINLNNGLFVLQEKLLDNLKINIESLTFNYNQYIYGGFNNYKYVDEVGLTHLFKLENNSMYQYCDLYDDSIKMVMNNDYTFDVFKNNKILHFNRNGYLERIIYQDLKEDSIIYNNLNQISEIITSDGKIITFKYMKNLMIVISETYNIGIFKEGKWMKVIKSNGDITKYFIDKKIKNLIVDKKELTFKYDKLNRITLISKKTNTNISNSKIKYKNIKTIFNKKIYYFNTTGIKTKEEGRD